MSGQEASKATIERIPGAFSVCKLENFREVDLSRPFHFAAHSERECSPVCPTPCVPAHAPARMDGWRAFRLAGQLDFSLVGILARIARLLAEAGIALFAISTYDTDYILVQKEQWERALSVLTEAGYHIL